MKKILCIIVFTLLCISVVGCGNTTKSSSIQTNTKNQEVKQNKQQLKNEVQKDGLKFTATAKTGDVKGDRTEDNIAAENGEYFADGSDIVKVSDYKDIIVNVNADNKTNKTIDLSQMYWKAELSDGYKLDNTMSGLEKDVQIQPSNQGTAELHFIVKKDVNVKTIKLEFTNVKDEDKYKNMILDAINGMNEEQLKTKYKDTYEIYNLEVNIE